jgi:hypothetical protein
MLYIYVKQRYQSHGGTVVPAAAEAQGVLYRRDPMGAASRQCLPQQPWTLFLMVFYSFAQNTRNIPEWVSFEQASCYNLQSTMVKGVSSISFICPIIHY